MDARITRSDANTATKRHLLLTEVKLDRTEFIEIYNPTNTTVDLSRYYLADTKEYALLPGSEGAGPMPSTDEADFVARFPSGAQIGSLEVQIIAINQSAFLPSYPEVFPSYHLNGPPLGAMRSTFDGSIGSNLSLTNTGEGIALFYWNGETDLVMDVDLVRAGHNLSGPNDLPNKGTLSVDGPDTNTSETNYQSDAFTMPSLMNPGNETSCTRILPERGHEVHADNGNGTLGHDETSEDTSATWQVRTPTPGSVVPELEAS